MKSESFTGAVSFFNCDVVQTLLHSNLRLKHSPEINKFLIFLLYIIEAHNSAKSGDAAALCSRYPKKNFNDHANIFDKCFVVAQSTNPYLRTLKKVLFTR